MTAEGDVAISDESLQGLGTTIQFLKSSLFGAVAQIAVPVTAPHPKGSRRFDPSTSSASHDVDDNEDDSQGIQMPSLKEKKQTSDQIGVGDALCEEEDPHIPLRPARRKEMKLTDFIPNAGYFLAGGLSGITSRTATAPLDRLKVYLIAQTENTGDAFEQAKKGNALKATKHGASALANACRELWAAGGIRSLFAGRLTNIMQYFH